jgi:arylsulfatase
VLPTLLDVLGTGYPRAFGSYRTRGVDGFSFAPMLRDAASAAARSSQHYELAANRGYIKDGWKIVSLQPPGKPIDLDNWMLFDLAHDPTEIDDRAKAMPAKVAELVAAFESDAKANHVYPLDNRDIRRALTVPPFLEQAVNRARTFYPDAGTGALAVVSPLVADRDFRVECTFTFEAADRGVIFSLGDPIAGMALFAKDGGVTFVYHGGTGVPVSSERLPVAAGDNRFVLEHRALGRREGVGRITVNGVAASNEIDMSPTLILGWVGEGLDVGIDRKQHVTTLYGDGGPCRYTGRVGQVRIEPGPQASDSYANRREVDAQRAD